MYISVTLWKGDNMEFMTVKEFAEKIKMSSHTVRRLIRDGKIYAMKPGSRAYRISENEIERLNLMIMYKDEK